MNQFPNTQVTVGGTTVNDIGGNLILDGANLDTKHLTGTVGGDLIVKSRQDAYQYTHDQKQAGFSADVGFDGKPQSFSINGGKTDADADYAQVTHQSGIKTNQSTLSVQGQGKFTGGYLITDAGKNQTQFAQGIQTQDIENHLNYEGDAIGIGVGIGANDKEQDSEGSQNKTSYNASLQGIGYGTIDPVNKTSTTHSAITDQAGLSHINTGNFKQEEVQHELNEIITNDFDKERVLRELNIQVKVTQEFRENSFGVIAEYADKKQADLRGQIKQTTDEALKTQLYEEIYKVQYQRRLLETLVGIISGTPDVAITQGTLQLAATKMREESLENSRQSPGFEDLGTGQAINNVAYDSGYFDGVKLGGTRLGTDVICGKDGSRCEKDPSNPEKFLINENGNYVFKPNDIYPNLQSFLNDKSKDAAGKLYGLTGGSQALSGTMFGKPYKVGGFVDLTTESFAGTHDYLGGQKPGYYDKDGNTKPGSNKGQGIATGLAIPISTPFALADLITPDFMSIILKIAR